MLYPEIIKIPFLRILIPLLTGIVIQEKVKVEIYYILPGLTLFFFLLLLYHYLGRDVNIFRNRLFGLLVFVVICLAGMGLLQEQTITAGPEKIRLGSVALIPQEKEKTYKLVLDRVWERGETGWHPVRGRILLYIAKSMQVESVKPGDLLVFYCPLDEIDLPANPMEFNFRRYCTIHGIFWRGYLDDKKWKQLNSKGKNHFFFSAERIRMKLLGLLDNHDIHHKDLVASLLLGYRENLDEQQRFEFTQSGAMHILAVSGLHVGIIYGLLVFILKPFFCRRPGLSFFITVPCIWFYAVLTGLAPSVSRASLMLSLYIMSHIIKRKSGLINIVFFSAFLMILFNPQVIYSVSFQLSFMAVTGIGIVFQELYAFLRTGNWLIDKILGLTCLSFSAQLFTFPLSVYYFHQFPHYFLVTNLFAIPLTALILYSGCMFFLFSFVPSLSGLFAGILDTLSGILQRLTGMISSLPYSATHGIGIDTYDVILIYIALISLIGFIRKRSAGIFFILLSVITIMTGKNCCEKIIQHNRKKFLICSVEGSTVLNFIDGYQNIVMTDDTGRINREKINDHINSCWIDAGVNEPEFIDLNGYASNMHDHSFIISPGRNHKNPIFIQFAGAKIGVLSEQPAFTGHLQIPLKLDLLIINASRPVDLDELIKYIRPGIIIIDHQVPQWLVSKLESECIRLHIPYHTIRTMGYYLVER